MDIIEKTRELGLMIQQDRRYIDYRDARAANDADEQLQQMIDSFNILRTKLNAEMSRPDKSSENIAEYDREIKETYNTIMENENMKNFTRCQDAMNNLLAQINTIITYAANGEDPMTCPAVNVQGCGGSCATCGGCG